MRKKVTKAIFPVAGLGTRFLPATKSVPKEIMTLVDRPLVQYAIDEARAAGIKEFIFVTSRGKGALEYYFDLAPQLEQELRNLDQVAYVRFASVYRNFREAKDFEDFLGELTGDPASEREPVDD